MHRWRVILGMIVGTVIGSFCLLSLAAADMEGSPTSGGWEPRTAIKPDPSKIVVPEGYKVEVFASGMDTPSAATVDRDGNVWVAISGNLFGPAGSWTPGKDPGPHPISRPKVMVFDKNGRHIKDFGEGQFEFILNEIEYCPDNGRIYVGEYGRRFWEISGGVNGTMRVVIKDTPRGDHMNGGITCKDGYLYFALGFPSNTGFSEPDNHGWVDEIDPFWQARPDGFPPKPHDPVCRDVVHTGLNAKSSDGRMTGALLPAGTPAQPGMIIKAQVPCGGSVMRVKLSDQGPDGIFPHNKMEVYAFGFRNQAGIAFGPKGSRFENALAVTDNGANDLGNRRVANGAEKLWIITEKGQDGGFPDREGMNFVTNKRFGWDTYEGSPVKRPYPNLYIGDKPLIPPRYPYRFAYHISGSRGVPLIIANPNPNGYINPVLEWDTNNPMDGVAWSWSNSFGYKNDLFTAVYGILDTGPESLVPTWPAVLRIRFLEPTGIQWEYFMRNIDMGPGAYQKPGNAGGLERPNDVVFTPDGSAMYVVDYGEVFVDFYKPSPFYTTPKSGVIWKVTRVR